MKNTLCILALFLIPFYGFCENSFTEKFNVKDSLQTILRTDTIDPETRFKNAHNLMFYYSSPEEAEALGQNIVYPFVKKTWESKSEQLAHLARLQLLVSMCYRERGSNDRDEKERLFAEKALETAKKSEIDATCARCYNACAYMEIKRGDVKKAHEYLYHAIKYYDKMEQYTKSSEMLYVIVSNFYEIKDTDGMQRVLRLMEGYLKKDTSKQSQYQYNITRYFYFRLLLEKNEADKIPVDYRLIDSCMVYIERNIDLAENYLSELDTHWMHGYAYYFLAKELDTYYPEQTVKIFFNLDKALEMIDKESFSRMNEANAVMELKIYIDQTRAKALFREGKIRESYEVMSKALLMLDELKNYKNLSVSRQIAYQFMVDYYEKTNRFAEALKFQKMLQENEAQRFENEKVQAINDMLVKYEVEKKEAQIVWLAERNQTAQKILILTVSLITVLLIALLIFIRFYKLRKKSMEQSIYESALLAELKQSELEQNLKEKEQLQQEYNELEVQANQNEQKAQSYDKELKQIKQQLEQKPTKTMIGKLTGWISKSVMDKKTKEDYIQQLSGLDIDMLEQGYLTANEKISTMDMKYIICFAIDMDVKDMSLLFNVEPASIRTVRYRIKKKFGEKNTFKFLM